MTPLHSLRTRPALSPFKKGDLLVLFGELFSRGYANGLVEEAEKRGLTIVRATVGRRDKDQKLRTLTSEESASIPQPFINIPLEAGFDMEPDSQGLTPVDRLKEAKLSDWENFQVPAERWNESKQTGEKRFKQNTSLFMKEIEKLWKPGQNVIFSHLMAGGVPRAKIVMPLMNRSVKGTGDRYLSSQKFWESSIGQLCSLSFDEVTAQTFRHLIELSTAFRNKAQSSGSRVCYTAYGYHGTEILIQDQYRWQSYTPYLQGWAKTKLEEIAQEYHRQGVHCCVYNCPEILTNSSSIFQGVELSLYPLLHALLKEAPHSATTHKVLQQCKEWMLDKVSFDDLKKFLDEYMVHPLIKGNNVFATWPQHSTQEQLKKMLESSEALYSWHKDQKNLITHPLSEVVFEACGYVMLHDSWAPQKPVSWIGHDLVARCV